MSTDTLSSSALARATALGTVLQTTMVLVGHSVPAVAQLFAIGGMTLSLVAGVAYARWARGSGGRPAVGGAIAGGVCGLIGIAISYALGDVTAAVLGFGTASSAVTGAIGGSVAGALQRRGARTA